MIRTEFIEEQNALAADRLEAEEGAARDRLFADGVSAQEVITAVARLSVSAPSWAVRTGGTRFGRFPIAGEPRDIYEKIDDVATLNSLTGANRSISLRVPWDHPDDPEGLRQYAAAQRVGFGAIHSTTFEDTDPTIEAAAVSYKFGSLGNVDDEVRKGAIEHNVEVIDLGVRLGSKGITVWLADGMNHPGQASFKGQFERVADGLADIHAHLPDDWSMFVEHKPYEPAAYSSVNNDWGSSLLLALATGERCKCLVDLGHHLPGTNVEQVVSRVAMTNRLGGIHFSDVNDVAAGSLNPFQLFLVFLELLEAGGGSLPDLSYMLSASHNVKDPIEDLIQATDAVQHALALALCVRRDELADAQKDNDPTRAAEVLHRAFRTDVRPLVAEARRHNGAAVDPIGTYRASGYRQTKRDERTSTHSGG